MSEECFQNFFPFFSFRSFDRNLDRNRVIVVELFPFYLETLLEERS